MESHDMNLSVSKAVSSRYSIWLDIYIEIIEIYLLPYGSMATVWEGTGITLQTIVNQKPQSHFLSVSVLDLDP